MTTSEAKKRYAERNAEKVRAAKRAWNNSQKGRENRRAWQRSDEGRAWFRAQYQTRREAVLDGYGRRCACCGETEALFLSIDHVHGGGRHERRHGVGTGIAFFNKIIRLGFPADYQILCHNCNFAKGKYGACPHTKAG